MKNTNKYKTLAVIVIAAVAIGALWCYMTWQPPPATMSEISESDRHVRVMEDTSKEFARVKETISTETKRKVVVVRENVVAEIRALDPDGLAVAALAEIELFRGHAGGRLDPGSAGLDGAN